MTSPLVDRVHVRPLDVVYALSIVVAVVYGHAVHLAAAVVLAAALGARLTLRTAETNQRSRQRLGVRLLAPRRHSPAGS